MPQDLVAELQSVWKQVKGDPQAMARHVLGLMQAESLAGLRMERYGELESIASRMPKTENILSLALAVCRNPPTTQQEGELWVESLVSQRDKQPYVSVRFRDEAVQMTIAQARHHALLVLECIEAATSDAFLVEFMRAKVGIEEDHIVPLLAEFRKFREKLARRDEEDPPPGDHP